MRRAAKVDTNQAHIVEVLRWSGATVQHLHMVGAGCPDLLVGFRGINFLLEVKDGDKKPSARKLTDPEIAFHENWRGHVVIVNSVDEALEAIGATQ